MLLLFVVLAAAVLYCCYVLNVPAAPLTRGWLLHLHVGVYVCCRLLSTVTLAALFKHFLDFDCSTVIRVHFSLFEVVGRFMHFNSCYFCINLDLPYLGIRQIRLDQMPKAIRQNL